MTHATKKVTVAKMPFSTRLLKQNQKVWLKSMSGNEAALCVGKHRGKNKYIEAWVSWRAKGKEMPCWKDIDIDVKFADRLGI